MFQTCIQNGSTCESCKFDSSNITDWDLSSIEETIKSTKDNCNDPKLEGSFAFCTKYLKESYDTALACMTSQTCPPNTPSQATTTTTTTTTTPACAAEDGPCANASDVCCGVQTCQICSDGSFLCKAPSSTTTTPATTTTPETTTTPAATTTTKNCDTERKNVRDLSSDEREKLNTALGQMKNLTDWKGFQKVANYHGQPFMCNEIW